MPSTTPPREPDLHLSPREAVAVAGHRGDVATAVAGLSHPDPSVRVTALGAVGRLGVLDADRLAAATEDPEPSVRRRACEVAAGRGDDDNHAAALVAGRLADPDPGVVEAACFALGELAARPAVPRLVEVAGSHPEPLCREAAVAALGAIGDSRGLAAILAATGDRPTVRRRAVLALAPFDGPEVDAALARALEDRDWQVRQAAEDMTAPAEDDTGPPAGSGGAAT